jgi:hypothetical protein
MEGLGTGLWCERVRGQDVNQGWVPFGGARLPKDQRLFAKERRPAQGIVLLGHQTRRAAVQPAARSPNELNPGLSYL